MATELQNCLTEANAVRRHLSNETMEKVAALVAAGKFVLVASSPYYCRSTDAFAGVVTSITSVHDTREAAEEALAEEQTIPSNWQEGVDFEVHPIVTPEADPAELVTAHDEIPF